jgi:hypothetical protein
VSARGVFSIPLPLNIDDFTSGPYDVTLTGPGSDLHYEAGASISGGARFTNVINAFDPRHTPVTLDVGSADRLNLTVGAGQYVRLEIGYGWTAGGAQAPLGLNLTALGGSAFRTNFEAVSGEFALNYNILAYLAGGWSLYGENLGPSPGPFSRDFSLANFTGPGGTDFGDVSFIVFIFQTWDDVAINSFQVV